MRQRPLIRAGLATLGLLLFLVAVGPGWAQEDPATGVAPAGGQDNTAQLQKVRAEIKRQQDLIRSLNAQAADARRDHEAIAQEIEATQRLMGGMVRKESLLLSESRRLEAELASRCLLYTSPSPRDRTRSRMPSSA